MRSLRCFAIIVLAAAVAPAAGAAEHGAHLALLAAQQGLETWDGAREDAETALESPLLIDGSGRRNLAETNLNWAAALLMSGERPELAREVIEATLAHQDTEQGSDTRGLFRWYADPGQPYQADATLYIAPALAWLATSSEAGALTETLRARSGLALQGLLSADRPNGGFGEAMWAGAVASLAHAARQPEAAEAAAAAVRGHLGRLTREGLGAVHSPTFDALRIGGLRWAAEFAVDEAARGEAREALNILYADMLQRYDPVTAMIAGAIRSAYPAEYLGRSGVPQYLLACDLPSALSHTREVSPLAMYFALSHHALPPELIGLAEGERPAAEIRTRTPDPAAAPVPPLATTPESDEDEEADATRIVEKLSTCTWVTEGMSLGTMSGAVDESAIPVLATCDLRLRPTTYFYTFGGQATVQSAQTGGLALCSFNFDGVGVGARVNVGLRGMLGRRDQVDRVLIGNHDWIGEPEAVGQNVVVAVRRGSSYVGVKVLAVGEAEGTGTSLKPAAIEWLREGNMDSLLMTVHGHRGRSPLPKPVFDVRVGLLVEVAPASQFGGLEEFSEHVAGRRVTQDMSEKRERIDDDDPQGEIPGRHVIKSISEMRFARYLYHETRIKEGPPELGVTEELLRNQLVSRTLPVELPPDYLWASPGLNLQRGGQSMIGPMP